MFGSYRLGWNVRMMRHEKVAATSLIYDVSLNFIVKNLVELSFEARFSNEILFKGQKLFVLTKIGDLCLKKKTESHKKLF